MKRKLHFAIALSVQCTFADRYCYIKGACCHHILPCRWRRHISAKYVAYFLFNKTKDALISQIYFVKKFYMFGAVPLPVISFPLYIRHWYMSCRFDDSFQAWLVMLESCMTYTSAECTVENSWWWAEGLPKTCSVSWQNKFGKLVHLLVLLKRNLLPCTVAWT